MPFSFSIKSELHRSLSAWANPDGDQSDCDGEERADGVDYLRHGTSLPPYVNNLHANSTSHVVVRNSCPRRINRVVAINMQKLVCAGPYSGGRRAAIATVRRSGIFVPLKDEIERLAPDVTKTVRRACGRINRELRREYP